MRLIRNVLWLFVIVAVSCGKNKQGNDVTPKMSFNDIIMAEGNGGMNTLEVTLTLDQGSSKQISVVYSTIDGTAKAGQDFTAASNQTITFKPNETQKKILIPLVADDIKEADESFLVRVESPINVILLKGSASITLTNDDTKIGFNNTGYDAVTSYPGYTLAWGDEFNGGSTDATAWTAEVGDGCPSLCGWGNNELEYYTNPPNNLFFQDGKMIIELKAETFGGKNYTSARIKTQGKKTFKFGRIDIRAILPKGKGVWPAFWMLPQNNVYGGWPRSGEIDLMENMGNEPAKVLSTVHYGPGPGSIYISRNYTLPSSTFSDQFHVFSFEWKLDQLKFYVDDNLFSTVNKPDLGGNTYPFNELFYFVINLAIGGNFPGAPDATTLLPQWLIIDYIRIYQ
jgi:beta-glucanase (GH16 family)